MNTEESISCTPDKEIQYSRLCQKFLISNPGYLTLRTMLCTNGFIEHHIIDVKNNIKNDALTL